MFGGKSNLYLIQIPLVSGYRCSSSLVMCQLVSSWLRSSGLTEPVWLLANLCMLLLQAAPGRAELLALLALCLSVIRLLPLSFQVLVALLTCQTPGTCS